MSKESILTQIRKNKPALVELPFIPEFDIAEGDLTEQFKKSLQLVGGQAIEINEGDIAQKIKEIFGELNLTACNDKTLMISNIDTYIIEDSRELRDVDLAVLRCRFGVAENGAVWLLDSDLSHRVLPFIAQHCVLIIPKTGMVWNMHEAYQLIKKDNYKGFGVFISGPSKTADIEQSLVIGAHGPKSLTVFLTT
ncbi:MAG: LUD domain-containing protein [Mariniphaga sp.]